MVSRRSSWRRGGRRWRRYPGSSTTSEEPPGTPSMSGSTAWRSTGRTGTSSSNSSRTARTPVATTTAAPLRTGDASRSRSWRPSPKRSAATVWASGSSLRGLHELPLLQSACPCAAYGHKAPWHSLPPHGGAEDGARERPVCGAEAIAAVPGGVRRDLHCRRWLRPGGWEQGDQRGVRRRTWLRSGGCL